MDGRDANKWSILSSVQSEVLHGDGRGAIKFASLGWTSKDNRRPLDALLLVAILFLALSLVEFFNSAMSEDIMVAFDADTLQSMMSFSRVW